MEIITFESLMDGAMILREADFRRVVGEFDWSTYRGKDVLIKGCGNMIIPTWAYMVLATALTGKCRGLFYGDPGSPVPVWQPSNEQQAETINR